MSLSSWLHKAADTAEKVEAKASASRSYAKSALVVLAIMGCGAFIAGSMMASMLSNPAALGAAMSTPFILIIAYIWRRFS